MRTRRSRHPFRRIFSSSAPLFTIFLLLLVATQTGNLRQEVIDTDESTFIIMASDVLQGHLPYLNLFDNKTPGIFFILALVMWVFGETLLVVRLFGDISVLIAAGATYFICRRSAGPVVSALAVSAMIAVTAIHLLQPTLTEHIVIALVMVSALLVVSRRDVLWSAFCVGLLMSVATITRLNVALLVVALGAYYAWGFFRPRPQLHRFAVLAYGAGGLLPLLVLLAAYWSAGGLDVLFLSTVLVPLSYSQNQLTILEVLQGHAQMWAYVSVRYPGIFFPLTVLIGWGGVKSCMSFFVKPPASTATVAVAEQREERLILFLLFGAMLLSILMGGAAWAHYWIQLLPFAAIFIATVVFDRNRRLEMWAVGGLTMVLITSSLVTFAPSGIALLQGRERLDDAHLVRRVAELIAADMKPADRVYAESFHLIYWYLKQDPPSPVVTHPANISQPAVMAPLVAAGYVPEDELDRLLESRPAYMIFRADMMPPPKYEPEMQRKLTNLLKREYKIWFTVNNLHVYRRTL